ncbi:hypothetical protein DGMP_14770 [Desulfomarina profundi]|uniref:Helix-hairpin-helix DNA-binding motif class 1 domain-containing protein n=1 Tax=Desulfomarina profundi TaxID=2772557 RepID=A0A8D5JGY7_9BACT|nr:helix-hairpin-helix domain-containing protein [Desulfomarina profundi]BCL60784.1 hypothetical protein DGMP_14770 [Desulfomarina profundi]
MNKKIDKSVQPRDKRFDALLFFASVLLLSATFDSSILTNENNYNLHEQLRITNNNLVLICNPKEHFIQPVTAPTFRPFFWKKIPINQADSHLLMTIKGIGPGLAEKIIEARERRGFFHTINDLQQIKGVGKRRAAYFMNVFDFGDPQ